MKEVWLHFLASFKQLSFLMQFDHFLNMKVTEKKKHESMVVAKRIQYFLAVHVFYDWPG